MTDQKREVQPAAWLQSQNGVEIVSKHRLDPAAFEYGWTEQPLYTAPPPAPGWDELEPVLSFLDELAANAASGKREALNPILIGGSAKLYAEGLREALRREAPASSGVEVAGIDAAAEYLVQTVKRTLWGSLRKDGRARDGGFEPFPHNPRQEDYRDVVREIVRLAAPPRPDAGCGVREALAGLVEAVRRDADEGNKGISGYTAARLSDARAALSKPTDASNASAVARLPDWGQIVQILLRCMDATIKNETSREQAERMANELLEKYPALSADGGEAKKSDGGKEPRGCPTPGACSCPSDPTADVTWGELHAFILANSESWEDEGAATSALLDAFTVGRR